MVILEWPYSSISSKSIAFETAQLNEIRKVSLASIACMNGDNIQKLQPSGMSVPFREAFSESR